MKRIHQKPAAHLIIKGLKRLKNKNKNILLIFFCTTLAIWVIGVFNEKEAASMSAKPSNEDFQAFIGIAKVSDGDSIKIGEKKVRLMGIDAPELKQTCFDANYNEYACGKAAKDFLVNLANEKEVKCYYEKFDKYNRYLAQCFVENIMINQAILRAGMAVTYTFSAPDEEMLKIEDEAKSKKIGIWQGAFQLPKDYRKAHPRK